MTELRIITRYFDDIIFLNLKGKIKRGEGVMILKNAFLENLAFGRKKIVLNLENLSIDDCIDGSGIGELVSSSKVVDEQGGKLVLLKVAPPLRDLLAITKLLTYFELAESDEEAIGIVCN